MNAEVITIGIGFQDMSSATRIPSDKPHMLHEKLKAFRKNYDAVLTEILTLESPTDTIIRVMDFHCPYVRKHKDLGIYEDTKRIWMAFSECIYQVSMEHGIPVAQVFQAMNGPDGDDDPKKKGYIAGGGNLTHKGCWVVADLFRELGYE